MLKIFELFKRKVCEMFVYKHSGKIENVIKKYPTFWKNANFTGE